MSAQLTPVPEHWKKLIPLLEAARKDSALLAKLKSGDTAEISSELAAYNLSAADLDAVRADLKGFETTGGYGIWFYAPVPD